MKSTASSLLSDGEHCDHPRKGVHTNELSHNDPLFEKRLKPVRASGQKAKFVITPPARKDYLSEETPFVTVEDLDEVRKSVIGAPVIMEHMAGEVLGRITATEIDEQRRIVATVEMEDTMKAWGAVKDIRSGKIAGCSLGQRFATNEKAEVTKKMPLELSLTTSPEFDEHTWAIEITGNSAAQDEYLRKLEPENDDEKHPDERAIIEFHATASSKNDMSNNLSFSKSGDGKTLDIVETMAGKVHAAGERAAMLEQIRQEERARVQARHEAEREFALQQQQAQAQAEAQAQAQAQAEAQAKAEAAKAEDPATAKLKELESSISKITQAFEQTQQRLAMNDFVKNTWIPTSQQAHLIPAETNIKARDEQSKEEILPPQQQQQSKMSSSTEAPEDETARLKKLISEVMQSQQAAAAAPPASAAAAPAVVPAAAAAKRKADEVSDDLGDEDEFDLAMDEIADEGMDLKEDAVNEEVRQVGEEMETRAMTYKKTRDNLLRDIEKFKNTRSEMDEETRIKRGGLLEKRKADFLEMGKEFKLWFSNQMGKFGKATESEQIRKVCADTVGLMNSKRRFKDDDLSIMKTQLTMAAASSKTAAQSRASLTSLHRQLEETRRERESARFAVEQFGYRDQAQQAVRSADPRSRATQKKAKTMTLNEKESRDLYSLAFSKDAFKPRHAQLVAAASSINYPAEATKDGEYDVSASSRNDELVESVQSLVQALSSQGPSKDMWVQKMPDMDELEVLSASDAPLYSATGARGSILRPPREYHGLNIPQTQGQEMLLRTLAEKLESTKEKYVNYSLFTEGVPKVDGKRGNWY